MEISNSLTIETTHRLDHETVLDLLAYSARTDYWIEGYWEKFMASGDGILLFTRLLEHEEQLASESDSLS